MGMRAWIATRYWVIRCCITIGTAGDSRCLPHSTCERVSPQAKGMDGAMFRRRGVLPEASPGLGRVAQRHGRGETPRCACMRRQGAPCNRAWGPGHHEGWSVSPGLGYRPRSDIHLGAELDDPVGRDLELIWRAQGVALQQHEELAPQIEVPGALLHDERLVSHEEGGLHHPAA